MKPVYQFPIPPLRPSSLITNAVTSSTLKEVNERDQSSEPEPKRARIDSTDEQQNPIAQHTAAPIQV
jgi:hypothetical protein